MKHKAKFILLLLCNFFPHNFTNNCWADEEQPPCIQYRAGLQDLISKNLYCASDSDCEDVSVSHALGCEIYVRKEVAEMVKSKATEYEMNCVESNPVCKLTNGVACRDSKCANQRK